MRIDEINESLKGTLERARKERRRLDDLIAGLELAVGAGSERKQPTVAGPVGYDKNVRQANGKRTRGPKSKKGEMDKAVLAALAHYNGSEASTTQVVKFVDKNRPASLVRKTVSRDSWRSRVLSALERMEKAGLVHGRQIPGEGIAKNWSARTTPGA